MSYKWITKDVLVMRLPDNACIPADPHNADWQRVLNFVKLGGVIADEDPPAPAVIDKREAAIEAMLAKTAQDPNAPQAVVDYAVEVALDTKTGTVVK